MSDQLHPDYFDLQHISNAEVGLNRIRFEMSKKHRDLIPTEDPEIRMDYVLDQLQGSIKDLQELEAKLTGVIKIEFDD